MLEELSPGQGIHLRVTTILFDSAQNIVGLSLAQEALLGCFIWEVKDDEPSSDGYDAGKDTLEDEDPKDVSKAKILER